MSDGNIAGRISYDPYGANDGDGTLFRFRYTGQQLLEPLNLYYYKARMYSPAIGRFLQTDPIGYQDGLNLYAYVGNNPFNRIDPLGLNSRDASMLSGGLGGIVLTGFTADIATPEPTDAALPKWVGWGVAIGGAVVYDWTNNLGYFNESSDNQEGCIYCVKGDKTGSGKDYIGSTDNLDNRKRDKTDGRDREGADIVDTYPIGDRETRRSKEQQAMNDLGGVDNLDNKRNEVAEKKWPNMGITPP
jgi:RHS repeat-associated protein